MKKIFTLISFLLLSAYGFGQYGDSLFNALLEAANLKFLSPDGKLESVTPVENRDMNYELALRHPEENFEIRIAVRPMDSTIRALNQNLRAFPRSVYMATLMNCSQMGMPEFESFDSLAVRQEFNAEWGATAFFPTRSQFGEGFQFIMSYTIHQYPYGDAYVFFLGDTPDQILELVMNDQHDWFHLIRFKE